MFKICQMGIPAVVGAFRDLVQVIEPVVYRLVALGGLIGQVAKAVIGIGAVVIAHAVIGVVDHAVVRVGEGGLAAAAVVGTPRCCQRSTGGWFGSGQKNRPLVFPCLLTQCSFIDSAKF